MNQTGAGDPGQHFDVTIECLGVGHQAGLLVLQHISDLHRRPVRVIELTPSRAALLGQPVVQTRHAVPALALGLVPDAGAPVAHVFLDDAFFPAAGHVTELGLEQVVPRHGFKPGIDDPLFAQAYLVNSGFHVVVDAALRYPTESGKGAGVRIKQHLMALTGVGHQPEGAAGTQLGVRHFQAPSQSTHPGVFCAPVKLEGLAERKFERHEGCLARVCGLLFAPGPRKGGHSGIAAAVAKAYQFFVHGQYRAPLALASVGVGLQPDRQCVGVTAQFAGHHPLRVLGLDHLVFAQPRLDRVSCQPRSSFNFLNWHTISQVQPPNLCQCSHFDHSLVPPA